MKRFFSKIGRFFWSWGFLKFILWAITLIVLLYVEEDWRGARAWAATKEKWEAKGESFDPTTYFPRPVPDEQNLAALPIFKLEPDPQYPQTLAPLQLREALNEDSHGGDLPRLGSTTDEMRIGLATAYAHAFPGKAVPASSLAQFDALYPVISELRTAAMSRPYCRFNQDYSVQPPMLRGFGLLTEQIQVSQRLSLHARIALAEKQPQVALDDIKTNFRLAMGVGRDPTLVAGLVAIGSIAINRSVIDDSLRLHLWNEAQLDDLQDELAQIDFLAQYQFALRGEAVTETIPNFNWIGKAAPQGQSWVTLYGWVPGGWLDLNKAKMVDFLFRESLVADPQNHRLLPNESRALEGEITRAQALPWRFAPWNILFALAGSPLTQASMKFAQIQVNLDEDRIVCALERYRLAHGSYPEALVVLAPTYIAELPHDIMNGEPYHYSLRSDGTFLLYSVGWNQKDDGGKVAYKTDGTRQADYTEGDWPWPRSPLKPAK